MTVALTISDGVPAVEIEAASGKVKRYLFRVEVQPGKPWTCSLQQGAGLTYRVREHLGMWSCTCQAWEFSKDRWGEGCKHTRCCRELRALLETMNGTPATEGIA